MIEQEILEILGDAAEDGSGLNSIADEFRTGRDVDEICVLLDSSDTELVSSGLWLLGELHFDLYNTEEFVTRLHDLVEHQTPMIRSQAFGALFPALDPQSEGSRAILDRLLNDPNKGVRMGAESAAAQWQLASSSD